MLSFQVDGPTTANTEASTLLQETLGQGPNRGPRARPGREDHLQVSRTVGSGASRLTSPRSR